MKELMVVFAFWIAVQKKFNQDLALVLVYWEFLLLHCLIYWEKIENFEPTPANLFQIYHVVYVLAVILCGCCVLALGGYVTRFCWWQHYLCGSQPVSVPVPGFLFLKFRLLIILKVGIFGPFLAKYYQFAWLNSS